jgi:HAE1 family hydrophobic/amphiphilic exporter-1
MKLVEFSLRRRVTVSMVAVALLLFGLVSFTRLPINLLPDLTYPSLTIETRLQGAAPAEVESLLTRPVEEIVGIVSGVKRLTSTSRPGLSQVTLEFEWGRDMDFAALDVRQKLDIISLPREAQRPVLLRFDPSNDPVMRLYLTGGGAEADLYQLRYLADEVVKKDLESTAGVAAIQTNGGYEEEIHVRLDQGKLALIGLGISEVQAKLDSENVNQAGGSLYEAEARYLVRSRNEFTSLADIGETILTIRDGRPVTLADVAVVERGHKQREVVTRWGGKEAVELALYKEGDANAVQVSRAVQSRLERTRKELPAGVEVVVGVDQARFIKASIDDVVTNAWQGGLIAVLVLLLFLKELRSTLVIALTIPISVIATFFFMYRAGTTLNIMSLGGLALSVGNLVDNSIVVLESIFRRRKEFNEPILVAARHGASEVGMAVVASTLTTVAVFLPVIFLEGVAAQLFRDQAVTVSISQVVSLIVGLTLIPLFCVAGLSALPATAAASGDAAAGTASRYARPRWPARRERRLDALRRPFGYLGAWLLWAFRWLFRSLAVLFRWLVFGLRWLGAKIGRGAAWASRPIARGFDKVFDGTVSRYPALLRWALRSRAVVLGGALVLFAFAVLAIPLLGVDLVPTFTQGEFSFAVELPEGTPLESTDRYLADVSSVLDGDARVGGYSTLAGGAALSLSSTGTEGENRGRIQVRMAEGLGREDEEAVAQGLRERLAASGRARFEFERPNFFSFRTPIEVEIYGDQLADLHSAADAIERRVETVSGLVDVRSSARLGNPELQVTFQRDRLLALGLDLAQVAETVRGKVQGAVATRFLQGDREIDILVRSVAVGQASVDDVRHLIVTQRDGVPIPLGAVADVQVTEGPSEIRRIGQKRAAVVAGNLRGRDMGSVAADVRREIANAALPAGVAAQLSGQEEEMARSMRSLLLAAALAVFLVYLVMASQFESLLHPFVILFCLPLGLIGAVLGLGIGGHTLNVVAMIGIVTLAGIVVNNGIVLIDAVNQLREGGLPRHEAIVQAGLTRLRPILMTSIATIVGLLPMAIGLGQGSELQAPLAASVIGGLTVGTLLTLVVIPVMYTVLDRKKYAADAAAAPAEDGDRLFISPSRPAAEPKG